MSIIRTKLLMVCALVVFASALVVAQDNDNGPQTFANYEELFDAFEKRRGVLITRYERITEQERVEPAEIERIEGEMQELDLEYAAALQRYVGANPGANDLMPARFELTITLSRLEDRLEDALLAASTFLSEHPTSELVADVRFVEAQTLFRIPGREQQTLASLERFIEHHPDRFEAGAVRMMRVRTLLFLNRVTDARRSLRLLLDSDDVKEDEDAREFIQLQIDNLDWVNREVPRFDLRDLAGERIRNETLAGKPTLLFVWDSTSGTCLGELPYVAQAQERFGDRINIVGISVNESRVAFEQWVARNPERIKFRNVWIDRHQENSLVRQLDVTLIPFNVLVDADGRVFRYDVRSDDLLRYAEIMTR